MKNDLHKLKAAELFEVPYDNVTEKQRTYAKMANYVAAYSHHIPLPKPQLKVKMIKLGNHVCDRLSGITGYVTTVTQYISGFSQYGIQPQSADGILYPDAYTVDAHLLYTSPTKEDLPSEEPEDCHFLCGDIVTTRIPYDSRKLIVTSITTHINGCVSLAARYLNYKGESSIEAMDHKMFIRYEELPVYISPNKENSQGIRNGAAPVRRKPLTSSRRVMRGL